MKQLSIIFAILLLVNCVSRKPQVITETNTVKDTIKIETTIIERDTVFVTEPTKAENKVALSDYLNDSIQSKEDCAEAITKALNNKISSNQNAKTETKVKGDTIYTIAHCDSLAIVAKIKDTFQKQAQITERIVTRTLPPPPPEKYVPFWIRILAWIGGISLVYHSGRFILNLIIKKFS